MSDVEDVKTAINTWMKCLDSGDLDGLLATVDPKIIMANEHQPTRRGIDQMRERYTALIANARTASTFDVEHLSVYGDFAVVVGHYTVGRRDKESGATQEVGGRLALNYRRHPDGSWKMVLDIDNND